MGLNYKIHYKKGKENVAADALSRRASKEEGEYAEQTCIISEWVKEVIKSYQEDEQVQKLIMARIFLDQVCKLHRMPLSMLFDRDRIFTSQFWTELFTLLETELNLSTAYHSQTDGQTERMNQLALGPYSHSKVATVENHLKDRQRMDELLKSNLQEAPNIMKMYVDQRRSKREFSVGDCVYLRLQPYRQIPVEVRKHSKLLAKYYRPY
ncbi:uncharacterized protein [Coffea arabica]|uniref:Integrase catalytic domain-containing protein n=1 Tax=Coffea arabica TaxID=13443 RepID=A0A6P6SN70_COFAR|nr:uncharacterized protein LOC113692943 [Coffea arabica]